MEQHMAQGAPVAEARYQGLTLAASSALLIGLIILEYAFWLPQYLTWPWWADHSVYATMAQGWDAGLKPYRDLIDNNFPGSIYLFWMVGKLCGWGNCSAYNAFDALLLGGFGAAVLGWSRRRFGTWLPGAVTLFALTSYYFGLDFSQVAQRDWHAALFAALAMMAIEAVPGWWGRGLSAPLLAIGSAIRPQVVMFVPGLLWALNAERNHAGGCNHVQGRWVDLRLTASWLVGFAFLIGILFLPLIVQGLTGDFVAGLRTVLPGTTYNPTEGKLAQLGTIIVRTLAPGRVWGLLPAIALLWPSASASTRRSGIGWLMLLGGSVAYMAITPLLRTYTLHAFWLIWAFPLGILVAMLVEATAHPWRDRMLSLLLIAMLIDVGFVPSACNPAGIVPAVKALAGGRAPAQAPRGYRHPYGDSVVLFPWADYQATLAYLRTELGPETRVANALKGIALNGPTGRLPAFPAESVTWLFVVRPSDEDRFITTLHATPDSVVIWAPGVTGRTSVPSQFPRLAQAIRELYEPAARFGEIEVWRRWGISGRSAAGRSG
jgi:hypothetical protein